MDQELSLNSEALHRCPDIVVDRLYKKGWFARSISGPDRQVLHHKFGSRFTIMLL